ncbi:hypothetical protein GCM10010174_66780 [Kutzneria viridogrisea]|uniref:Uncharacterized protein n=2 Tax=Kutzneria TaxID=43356 RepID=W5WD78_9PSEU|nr:hypothetical protein KALB_5465 [Kutzneria albida DSM 43870]MBA8923652.1 hypothetical protein [Kutzneria viridogrisea]
MRRRNSRAKPHGGEPPAFFEPLTYYYRGSHREFPPEDKIPQSTVAEGMRELLMQNGDKPALVTWRHAE